MLEQAPALQIGSLDSTFSFWHVLTKDKVKVYLYGKLIADEKYTGGFSKGYLTFGDSRAVDTTIDNVVIYTGDYDRGILEEARVVANTIEKLSTSWGAIKNQ